MEQKNLHIVIADRNSNVSELLRREFAGMGYRVSVSRDCNQIIGMLLGKDRPDLLILDPELTCPDNRSVMVHLVRDAPRLPVILHAFEPETLPGPLVWAAEAVVEKGADPERLKKTVDRIFRRLNPDSFA